MEEALLKRILPHSIEAEQSVIRIELMPFVNLTSDGNLKIFLINIRLLIPEGIFQLIEIRYRDHIVELIEILNLAL